MKKTIATLTLTLAATAGLQGAAEAHSYSQNEDLGAHMMNPVCKDGATIYRVRLRNDSNRGADFTTQVQTLGASQAQADYIYAGHRGTYRLRVSGLQDWELRTTHAGEVLVHRAHLTNICD